MIYYRYLEDGKIKQGTTDNENVSALAEKTLVTPVTPNKIIAVGLNYLDHIKEFGDRPVPENPTLFIKFPDTVIGPNDDILLPAGYDRVDYEAELAVVISQYCYKVSIQEAKNYILGATCLNDVTERTVQKKDGQWIRGKNYPTFCPVGPYIVSGIDYNHLDIKSTLNGKVMQSSNTEHFIWNVYELVSFISQSIPLEAGDVVTTGTPNGVSGMKDGDEIIIEIEGIGKLINYVKEDK
ncbi:MAG: fumarylacetoacetate hydrolase family protein [Clostridia bacterium]|nr:fumarylacetoacetate hydrolase family protein [Clostridia bacterium]